MQKQHERDKFYEAIKEKGKNAEDFGEIKDLCVYTRFRTTGNESIGNFGDILVNGALFVLLARGKVDCVHNSNRYSITGPCMVFNEPGSSFSIGQLDADESDIHVLYFTRAFLEDLNLSLTTLVRDDFLEFYSPEINLTEKELTQLQRYIKIIRTVMEDNFNMTLNRHIVSSLVSSLIYQVAVYSFKHLGVELSDHVPNRRSTYVREFVRLVHLNYANERSLSFYANKLCVSPKYLSILVKESTGRSAAAWINHFVIMEAKNLLRFSGKNVQQVAYSLNFINQSAFGKYFKHITGMSPSEYQRSC